MQEKEQARRPRHRRLPTGRALCLAWCWVPCFAFTSVQLAGAPAFGLPLGGGFGAALCVLCVLSGSFFMHCGGLLSLAPSSFDTGTVTAVKGEHAPHTKMPAYQTHAKHSHVCGTLRACRIKPIEKKNSVPQKTRAAPSLARFEGVVSGHARVRSYYDAPACAARNVASRASALPRTVNQVVDFILVLAFLVSAMSRTRGGGVEG